MKANRILTGIVLLSLLAVFLAACASAQAPAAAPAATQASAAQAAPTSAPAATATTAAAAPAATATTASASGGDTSSSGSTSGGTKYALAAGTEANYRVREQLMGHDLPNDAVGKTTTVSGAVIILADGSIDQANSKITVDVSTLQSDQSRRDGFVSRNVLQTDQYPNVVFVPTSVKGLSSPLPQSGSVTFQVTGNLTVRDTTKPVTWDVTGDIANGKATGKATTTFTFEDFNLTQPKVPMVLSLEDKIVLEVAVVLEPAK
jgi:polyisoprenoid-binding protein YceI